MMINMGVIQAKAEMLADSELTQLIKSHDLNETQVKQLKSHLHLVRYLKKLAEFNRKTQEQELVELKQAKGQKI